MNEAVSKAVSEGGGQLAAGAQVGVLVSEVGPEAAAEVLSLIRAAFGTRPEWEPPSTALEETEESVADALAEHGGLLASSEGRPLGALLFGAPGVGEPEGLVLRRVSVLPDARGGGVAQALAESAADCAARRGVSTLILAARTELPTTVERWTRQGFGEIGPEGTTLVLARELPVTIQAPTAENTRELGRRLAAELRAGDLVILTGELGAGKTTLAAGIGAGLRIRGEVTSPTFVISRVHPSSVDGPGLVHVDAYRLEGAEELEDLDLATADAVTLVEWGHGLAEGLAEDRLEVSLTRAFGAEGDGLEDTRTIQLTPVGARWVGSGLSALVT